jgi:hypothetical protein
MSIKSNVKMHGSRRTVLVSLLFVMLFVSLFVYVLIVDADVSALENATPIKTEINFTTINNTTQGTSSIFSLNTALIIVVAYELLAILHLLATMLLGML